MEVYLWTFISIIGVSIAAQSFLTWLFLRVLASPRPQLLSDAHCPFATVVLCLRGGDPFLLDCLKAVHQLDYPEFEFLVIVDHEEDPALSYVQEFVNTYSPSNVRIEFLKEPLDGCSLKSSSLIQAVENMAPKSEIYAQLDADTIVHSSWLRELATALADPKVGIATGNRWYSPKTATVASQVRAIWNAAAAVQMYCYNIAWGGTLAVRKEVIERVGLLDFWRDSFAEDTLSHAALKPHGLHVKFIPSLLMDNRESCELGGFFSWCTRQLFNARLSHPFFPLVILHGFGTTFLQAVAIVWMVISCLGQDWYSFAILCSTFAIYHLTNVLLLMLLERRARKTIDVHTDPASAANSASGLRWSDFWKALTLTHLTQFLYTGCLIKCLFVKKVDWRGVSYLLKGSKKIVLEKYIPYHEVNTITETKEFHSL